MTPFDMLANSSSRANFTGRMAQAGRERPPMTATFGGDENYTENDVTMDNVPEPFYGDSYESQANRESVQAEDRRSIALESLRAAMDEQRVQGRENVQADLSNDQLEDEDFNTFGRNRAVTRAGVANEVADLDSEAEAERGFGTWANRAYEREQGGRLAQTEARYGAPAQINAQGDFDAAQVNAQGRIGAARVGKQGNPMEALYKALDEFQAKQGRAATSEEVATFKQVYGVQ